MNRIEIQPPQQQSGGAPKHVLAEMRRTQGFLTKKGGAVHGGGWRNWKRRWFVIRWVPNHRTGGSFHLNYYKAKGDSECKGSINLQDAQVLRRKLQHSKGKVEFEFQLLLKNGNMLQMYADSAMERDEWVHSLSAASNAAAPQAKADHPDLEGYNFEDEDTAESFEAGELIASQCQAFGPGIFGGEVGHPAAFGIQSNNTAGMPLQVGGLPFTATLEDQDHLYNVIIADKEDGTYEGRYVTSRPGEYQLYIKLNDVHSIQGSPFQVTIGPARTCAAECSVDGLQARVTANTVYTFNIIARDAFGNPRLKGGDPFEVGIAGTAMLTSLEDNEDGTYTCSFETLHPEISSLATPNLEIQVTVFGKNIRDSPFRLVMHAASASVGPAASYRSDMFTMSADHGQLPYSMRGQSRPGADAQEPMSARQAVGSAGRDIDFGGSPGQAAQPSSPGARNGGGGASSRLQAARERVIRARQLQEQARARDKSPARAEPSSRSKTPPSARQRGPMSAGGSASKSQSSRSVQSQAQHGQGLPNSQQVLPALDFQVPPQPSGLNEEQQILWSSAAGAVEDTETLLLLQDFQEQLEAVFVYFSASTDRSGTRLIQFLASADSGPGQGYLRMLQQYDICPTYVSKRDAKKAYLLMCKMYNTTENDGLPINGFVHALVLTTLLGLSRPTYQNLYPQIVNKVNVMIKMWGVGVPHKLQVLKSNKRI